MDLVIQECCHPLNTCFLWVLLTRVGIFSHGDHKSVDIGKSEDIVKYPTDFDQRLPLALPNTVKEYELHSEYLLKL